MVMMPNAIMNIIISQTPCKAEQGKLFNLETCRELRNDDTHNDMQTSH